MKKRTILVFIDGLGWGETDPAVNPQYAYGGDIFRLPAREDAVQKISREGWARPSMPCWGCPACLKARRARRLYWPVSTPSRSSANT